MQFLQVEEPPVPVEFRPAGQQTRPDLEPFQAVFVTAFRIDVHAVQIELVLVPAANDVQAGAAVATWSIVAIALAAKAGVTSGTCTVENIAIRLVSAASAAPCVSVSNDRP